MGKQRIELDVDFIGTQQSTLTKKEEKAISEYLRTRKAKKKYTASRKKVNA
jgi:hypothetical protein